MKNKTNIFKEIVIFLLTICSICSLVNKPDKIFAADATFAVLFLLLYALFRKYLRNRSINKMNLGVSMMMSAVLVIGYSYQKTNSMEAILTSLTTKLTSIILFVGFSAFLYVASLFLSEKYQKYKDRIPGLDVLERFTFFQKHPRWVFFFLIMLCWLPYIIAYYPGMIAPDGNVQLGQFYGIDTTSLLGAVAGTSQSTITGHHPVAITYLFGAFIRGGQLLGSATMGLFVYVGLQTVFMAALFANIIQYLRTLHIHKTIPLVALLCYALVPFFPHAAMTMVKDSLSILFFMLFAYCILRIYHKDRCSWLVMFAAMMGMALSRKEYVYIILIVLLLVILSRKDIRKKSILALLAFFCLYQSVDYVFFHVMEIPKGSVREMLSVPFQQTARLSWDKGFDVYEPEDQAVINKVLDGDQLAKLYKPRISDPVKATYIETASKQDLVNYFKVWIKYGLKYPDVYISATVNNTYGYFYPGFMNTTGYSSSSDYLKADIYQINEPEAIKPFRSFMIQANLLLRKLAPFNLLCRLAFYTWALLAVFAHVLKQRKFANLIPLMPFLLVLCVCMISPVSGNFRYSYGMIFGFPFILAIGAMQIHNEKDIFCHVAKLIKKYREILVYLIVGILTTLVSIASYYLFSYPLHINYLIANFLSWVCAVVFAYVTNKVWVFQNRNFALSYMRKEAIAFVGSRVVTLIIDMLIMFVMVSLLHMNDMVGKIIVQVVVTILNYVFSKFFVFEKQKK